MKKNYSLVFLVLLTFFVISLLQFPGVASAYRRFHRI
jgi:hypothetical protein